MKLLPVLLGACPRCAGAISLMGDQYGDDWRCSRCGWAGDTYHLEAPIEAPKKRHGRRCCVCGRDTNGRCRECLRYVHRDRDACRKAHECAAKQKRVPA